MVAHVLGGSGWRGKKLCGAALAKWDQDISHPTRSVALYHGRIDRLYDAGGDAWGIFVERCLKFEAKQRLGSPAEFAKRMSDLLEQHSPQGDVEIRASEMPLFAARLPDGTDTVARVIRARNHG
jgi:hypothetical protein